jgi:hypothetical protein
MLGDVLLGERVDGLDRRSAVLFSGDRASLAKAAAAIAVAEVSLGVSASGTTSKSQ